MRRLGGGGSWSLLAARPSIHVRGFGSSAARQVMPEADRQTVGMAELRNVIGKSGPRVPEVAPHGPALLYHVVHFFLSGSCWLGAVAPPPPRMGPKCSSLRSTCGRLVQSRA